MIIKELEQMESIVSKNKALSWDGWTVVSSYPSDRASVSKNGAMVNGKWCMVSKISPNRDGWDIPDKYLG
jgi:hypothetical protein